MATLCKNCGHALVFDPAKRRLMCSACGSLFFAEEVESESKSYRRNLEAESLNKVNDTDESNLMDCYVYTCSECGGEIIVNGTEASTTCVYCGNPSVVFSRIARQKCPEFVLPFSITKERAIELARKEINKGFFVPSEIKNFSVDCCRGIYLPYWIVNAEAYDVVAFKGEVGQGKNIVTKYFGRAGAMSLKNLPIDASKALSDETSARLEPYALERMVPFDEDYLAGFYSNVTDVTYSDVREAVTLRADEYFRDEAKQSAPNAINKVVLASIPSVSLDNDMVYVMLPAWFISFNYEGKHNTILVNGDSGKVVCALPWKKSLFIALLVFIGLVFTILAFILLNYTIPILLLPGKHGSSSSTKTAGELLVFLASGVIALFSAGIRRVVKVLKNINLTQDKTMFNFMKKRQG